MKTLKRLLAASMAINMMANYTTVLTVLAEDEAEMIEEIGNDVEEIIDIEEGNENETTQTQESDEQETVSEALRTENGNR